jgi:hypothetical protein
MSGVPDSAGSAHDHPSPIAASRTGLPSSPAAPGSGSRIVSSYTSLNWNAEIATEFAASADRIMESSVPGAVSIGSSARSGALTVKRMLSATVVGSSAGDDMHPTAIISDRGSAALTPRAKSFAPRSCSMAFVITLSPEVDA